MSHFLLAFVDFRMQSANGITMYAILGVLDFTVLKRRHHCRLCGKVVCGVCSGNNLPIPYKNNKAERVCDECFDKNAADDTAQTGQGTLSRITLYFAASLLVV